MNIRKFNDVLKNDFIEIIHRFNYIDQFKNKTFLIVGATSFIGSVFIKLLIFMAEKNSVNIKILGIARSQNKVKTIYRDFLDYKGLKFYYCDLSKEFPHINGKIDYILHTVGVTQSKNIISAPVETIKTSIWSLEYTLKLASIQKANAVYLSSVEVYGQTCSTDQKRRESEIGYMDLSNIRNCYGESKRLCEILCKAYAEEFSVNVKIARLAQTFGAGILPNDHRIFVQFAQSIMNKRDIVLHTNGHSEGNYCYISDAIAAILLLLVKGQSGEVYNISNEANHMTILDMAQLVQHHFNRAVSRVILDIPINHHGEYPPDSKTYMSSYKINQLGWNAHIDLLSSYERLIQYIKEENT